MPRGSLTVSLSITFQINTSHRRSCEIEFPHRKKKRGKKRWSCKAEGLTLFLVTAHWITCRHASGALRDTEQSWPTRAKPQRLQAVHCVPVLVNCWTENISITVINSIIKGNSADSQALSGLGGVHSLSLSVGGYLQGGVCHQAALGGAALKPSDTLAAKKAPEEKYNLVRAVASQSGGTATAEEGGMFTGETIGYDPL